MTLERPIAAFDFPDVLASVAAILGRELTKTEYNMARLSFLAGVEEGIRRTKATPDEL